ncbi:putative transporter [Selenomonas ruminantium subsp. lactilytica TAM6421]|uniref:Putative transporter n=2 Tax=Selenomonas ruminantium TaxID=971 RepID=I0GLZ6_SELRL|nr:putative transporter [Selenomonas ruminantium subsp. lactilytica TAM6421]
MDMMNNFWVAVGAVVPLFTLLFMGLIIKRLHLMTETELAHTNRMVFKLFFFCMMFYNIYVTDLAHTVRPKLMLFGGLGVLAVCFLATALVCWGDKDNRHRGAMIQAIFRSNFVLFGIPIVGNIFGDSALAIPTMMIAVIVPIYNVLAVFILETFRGGRFALGQILLGILKNPMIMGAIIAVLLRLMEFPVPKPVLKGIGQVAAATTPVALIILGASFKGGSFHNHLPQLISCVTARLIIVPAIALSLAVYLGFRDIELVTLLAVFASPCAVASFAMAQQMGSDADLAGNCVVYTTALSCLTIFGWVFLLKTLGLF